MADVLRLNYSAMGGAVRQVSNPPARRLWRRPSDRYSDISGLVRVPGIDPGRAGWKPAMLPLHLTRDGESATSRRHDVIRWPLQRLSELAPSFDLGSDDIPSREGSKPNQQIRYVHAKRETEKLGQ